ncbi:MAG: hypothetical protein HQL75_00560 [Magnetococcales bacterium]|nr:hypothetical protein [Magnetococcales bacterium]
MEMERQIDRLKIVIARNLKTGEWLLLDIDGRANISTKDEDSGEIKQTLISNSDAEAFLFNDRTVVDTHFAACAVMKRHSLFPVLLDQAMRAIVTETITKRIQKIEA